MNALSRARPPVSGAKGRRVGPVSIPVIVGVIPGRGRHLQGGEAGGPLLLHPEGNGVGEVALVDLRPGGLVAEFLHLLEVAKESGPSGLFPRSLDRPAGHGRGEGEEQGDGEEEAQADPSRPSELRFHQQEGDGGKGY